MDDQTPIEHPVVTRAIANAQVQTEGYHFDIRKHLVEYDDVLNKHREIIYDERRKVLSGADLRENILSMLDEEMEIAVDTHFDSALEELDVDALLEELNAFFPVSSEFAHDTFDQLPRTHMRDTLVDKVTQYAHQVYEGRESDLGAQPTRFAERFVMLRVIDRLWMEHLTAMEHMRHGIGLRAAGQQKPLDVYKKEGHALFEGLLAAIKHDVAAGMFRVSVKTQQAPPAARPPSKTRGVAPDGKKVGRNDPCPCGSGRKYKHCCGK
ncbi:MAG: SEC-C domain-containing protein [Chloroflexi bacterium]|nr:SEC-C domain-containing protein [Chloroflexota bacterium]